MLTPEGQRAGEQELNALPLKVREYVGQISEWILTQSFATLVGSIYKAYPRMRANSIFVD